MGRSIRQPSRCIASSLSQIQSSRRASQQTRRFEKTIQQIASLCQKNPRPPGNGSTKTPNVLLPLPWLQGLGQQMKKEGHRTAQCGGPSARKHEPPPRALLCTLHPSHSVPQFPPLSSQRVPTGDYSAKRAISFGMRQNTKSCQVKFGRSLRVSAHRT